MVGAGHELVSVADNPDVIVLNTCGVTSDAMRKSRNLMRRFAALGARLLILMGCAVDLMNAGESPVSDDDLRGYVRRKSRNSLKTTESETTGHTDPATEIDGDEALAKTVLFSQSEGVARSVAENKMACSKIENGDCHPNFKIVRIYRNERSNAVDIISRAVEEIWGASAQADRKAYRPRIRCFIKIEDGCNNACTYCSVRIARGRERSVPSDDIIAEIRRCLSLGEREIVLAGVQLGAWKDGDRRLPDLIDSILSGTDVERLRLSSIEPWHLRPELYQLWIDKRLCPHFHTPVQSGSDEVLSMMRRRTHLAEFEGKIADLRAQIPDVRISTDLIVGFPGETDEMWQSTLDFIERVRFDDIHLFRFSARPGTVAATLPNPVPPNVKRDRWNAAHTLMTQIKRNKMQSSIGSRFRVLWETPVRGAVNGKCRWCGYTENYLRIYRDFDANKSMRGMITFELFCEKDIIANVESEEAL